MCPLVFFSPRHAAPASILTKPIGQALISRRTVFDVASGWVGPSGLAACVVEWGVERGGTTRCSRIEVLSAVGEEAGWCAVR
jgi:hypothetical protein